MQSGLDFDSAVRAPLPRPAEPVQPSLLGGDAPKPVLERQASVVRVGAGRPVGSGNRFNRDLVKMVSLHFGGRHILDVMAERIARAMDSVKADPHDKTHLDEIKQLFGCKDYEGAGAVLQSLMGKVIDATTPRLQHIRAEVKAVAPVIFDMTGEAGSHSFDEDGDLLDITPRDFNDLEGNGG